VSKIVNYFFLGFNFSGIP